RGKVPRGVVIASHARSAAPATSMPSPVVNRTSMASSLGSTPADGAPTTRPPWGGVGPHRCKALIPGPNQSRLVLRLVLVRLGHRVLDHSGQSLAHLRRV